MGMHLKTHTITIVDVEQRNKRFPVCRLVSLSTSSESDISALASSLTQSSLPESIALLSNKVVESFIAERRTWLA